MTSREKNEIDDLHGEGAVEEFLYSSRPKATTANLDRIRSSWGKLH